MAIHTRDSSGFTLIELLAVLTLMALVVGAVAIRWNKPFKTVKFESQLEAIVDFDFKARRHASERKLDSQLFYDVEQNQVAASRWVNGTEKSLSKYFSDGFEIEEIWTRNGRTTESRIVPVYQDGSTPTYAILIGDGIKQRWIIFAGRTGQAQVTSERDDVKALFEKLRIQGADAN